jgi:hypothetical protein
MASVQLHNPLPFPNTQCPRSDTSATSENVAYKDTPNNTCLTQMTSQQSIQHFVAPIQGEIVTSLRIPRTARYVYSMCFPQLRLIPLFLSPYTTPCICASMELMWGNGTSSFCLVLLMELAVCHARTGKGGRCARTRPQ